MNSLFLEDGGLPLVDTVAVDYIVNQYCRSFLCFVAV